MAKLLAGKGKKKQKVRPVGESFITEKEVQLSFVYLDEPKEFQDGSKPKYSVTCLVDKDDTELIDFLTGKLCSYYEVDDLADIPCTPFHNGNTGELNDGDSPEFAEYKGYQNKLFFKASTAFEGIQDQLYTDVEPDGTECETREASVDEIHSGCYAKVVLTPAEYKVGKNEGVTFYLEGVVKTGKGENWSQGKSKVRNLLGLGPKKGGEEADEDAKEAAQAALTGGKKKKKIISKPQREEEEDTDEEEEEDEKPISAKRSALAKARVASVDEDEDEDEGDEEEETPAPKKAKKTSLVKSRPAPEEDEEEDEDEEEEEEEKPAKKKKTGVSTLPKSVQAKSKPASGLSKLIRRPE